MDTASPAPAATAETPSLPAIQALAAADMAAVDALIRRRLASDVVLVNQVAEYIIGAGGKRLRPMLLLLAATALGKRGAGGDGAGADAATCDALHAYGLNLGYAFQIADDVLDYSADETALGKHLGDDLAEGKATLPLIHAIAHAGDATRERLRQAIIDGDTAAMPEVLAAIEAAGSLAYSLRRAGEYAQAAERSLDGLADNPHVAALRGLARYTVNRDR